MPSIHDWPNLRKEFDLAVEAGNTPHLKAWCEAKNLTYTMVSRRFSEMDDLKEALVRRKLRDVSPKAVDRIVEAMASADHRIGIEAGKAILDRAGFSPQAINIVNQANAQANQAVIIPPMFANSDIHKVKEMLGGE